MVEIAFTYITIDNKEYCVKFDESDYTLLDTLEWCDADTRVELQQQLYDIQKGKK